MKLASNEFINAINSKNGKKYYEAWLRKNKSLQRQYEVKVIQPTYDYDDDEEDD